MCKKAIVDAAGFYAALAQVSRVLRRVRVPFPPALSQVKVHFSNQRCILSATDLDTWLIKEIPAQGDDFSFVFRRTKDIVKACRYFEGDIAVEFSETGEGKNRKVSLCLFCGNRSSEFGVLDTADYPEYTAPKTEGAFSMNAATLLKRVEHVSYAVPKAAADARPSMAGVQCSGYCVYALDGIRMACDTDSDFLFPQPFMAYADALRYLKLFGDRTIKISVGNYRVQFADEATTLDLHMPGKEFYPVDKAVPPNYQEKFTVCPKEFLKELKYLKGFAGDANRLHVRLAGGKLFMTTAAGTYRSVIEITGAHTIRFAFDLYNMMDALKQFEEESSVTVKVISSVAPIIIEAENRTDFALVCPVRLPERLWAA